MNMKDNIYTSPNNSTKNNSLTNSGPGRFVINSSQQVTNQASKPSKNKFSTPKEVKYQCMSIEKEISKDSLTIHNTSPQDSNLIKELNSFLFEKILDREFISEIARKFVDEIQNSSVTEQLFKESFQKDFINISYPERNETENNMLSKKKSAESTKSLVSNNIDCQHKNLLYYAKGMCKNCYHKRGRKKVPVNCSHDNRALYALGLCKQCYQSRYTKSKTKSRLGEDFQHEYSGELLSRNPESSEINSISFLEESGSIITKRKHNTSIKSLESKQKGNKKYKQNVKSNSSSNTLHQVDSDTTKDLISSNKQASKLKERLFKIQRIDSTNLIGKNDNIQIEESYHLQNNSRHERTDSFCFKDQGNQYCNNYMDNNDMNQSSDIANNGKNNSMNNNNLINDANIKSYFSNMFSNNTPFNLYKGTFPNPVDEYSLIEDFCGNFFENNHRDNFEDSKSDSNYSVTEDF